MMTDQQYVQLVTDYMSRLQAEAGRRLTADRAAELVDDIRTHLAEAIPPNASPSEVRIVLDRMGDPSDLVDAAGGAMPPTTPPAPRRITLELWAIGLLAAGLAIGLTLVLWFVSIWFVAGGLVLVFLSSIFTARDKVIAFTANVVFGAPSMAFIGLFSWHRSEIACTPTSGPDLQSSDVACSGASSGITWGPYVFGALVVIGIALQIYTLIRLRGRARAAQTA